MSDSVSYRAQIGLKRRVFSSCICIYFQCISIWGHPKKVVQRAFQNHVDCLEQKEFLQWNTRTKDYLCANFQDIWLSSKSWILDIKYAISTIKMQILNQFFRKKIHYIVVICVPSFHQPARSSSFFLAFCLQFYGTTFYG